MRLDINCNIMEMSDTTINKLNIIGMHHRVYDT